jgi:hypothetical protein
MIDFTRKLNQTCTYWAQNSTDRFGKGVFASPVLRPCRWEDVAELYISKKGQETVSKARVFLEVSVALDGYLAQGDFTGTADPLTISSAFEVQQVKNTPNLRNLQSLTVAYL